VKGPDKFIIGYAPLYVNPYTSRKERTNRFLFEMFSLFLLVLKMIFFANAKSDISLRGSDIARQCLAVIFYSPKLGFDANKRQSRNITLRSRI